MFIQLFQQYPGPKKSAKTGKNQPSQDLQLSAIINQSHNKTTSAHEKTHFLG